MKIDIHTGVITFVALLSILAAYGIFAGVRSIRKARTLKFFRMRRDRMVTGWRMLFLSVVFILVAILTRRFAEPIAYHYFPPTATPLSNANGYHHAHHYADAHHYPYSHHHAYTLVFRHTHHHPHPPCSLGS